LIKVPVELLVSLMEKNPALKVISAWDLETLSSNITI